QQRRREPEDDQRGHREPSPEHPPGPLGVSGEQAPGAGAPGRRGGGIGCGGGSGVGGVGAASRSGDGDGLGHARLLVLTANRPCGRTCRKMMMATKTSTLATDAVVEYSKNECRTPSANAAITAPRSWPRPPTTTTRNASMRYDWPIVGLVEPMSRSEERR